MSSNGGMTKSQKIAFIKNWLRNTDFESAGRGEVDRITSQIDFEALVDNTLPAAANWELIKDELGLKTKTEFEEQMRAWEEAEIDHLRAELRDQLDEYGIEGVADALAGNPGVPRELQERVESVLEEYPPDVYDAEIRNRVGNIFDVLGDDFRVVDADRLEELREEAARVATTQEAEDQVLEAFRASFGQQFESVDDAIRSLQERLAQARGERLRIAGIQARRSGDDVLVRIDDGDTFESFDQLVTRRARRGIAFPPNEPATWTTIGEIRLRGGELERVSLEQGVDRYAPAEDAEDVPIVEERQTEQAGLPTEDLDREGDDLAEQAIRLLERE